jgi:hypothetical protein
MAYENSAGIGVSNHYGPRDSGGTEGITKTEGSTNEWSYDPTDTALGFGFPSPATGQNSVWILNVVDAVDPTDNITAMSIGGVAVFAATLAVPIEIPAGNTGVISAYAGGTGRCIVTYSKSPAA